MLVAREDDEIRIAWLSRERIEGKPGFGFGFPSLDGAKRPVGSEGRDDPVGHRRALDPEPRAGALHGAPVCDPVLLPLGTRMLAPVVERADTLTFLGYRHGGSSSG